MAYTTIDDPSAYHQTVLYTGNSGDNSITNVGNSDLQPDWIWVKNRDAVADHLLFDSTRGFDGQNDSLYLEINSDVESHDNDHHLKSYDTDGFTMQADDARSNESSDEYVAFQWKANGGTRVTYSESGDNPAGGYQVNTTAGFSIVDWTGTGGAGGTAAHGLGAVPHVIITKTRSHANDWAVYHHKNTSAPETDYLVLNSTAATVDNVNRWNDTKPTSTNLVFGDVGGVNSNDQTQIAYVFTGIKGYSKFGSFTGNGDADGPFVYLGFKPAWILYKRATDGTNNWGLIDSTRNPLNPMVSTLTSNLPNDPGDASGNGGGDFLSNGWKIGVTAGSRNASGVEYIYMAFAEHPFVSSEGVPVTAR